MIRAINPVKDFIAYRKIKKILNEIQPDIVHTHSAKAGILGRYAAHSIRNKHNAIHNWWHGHLGRVYHKREHGLEARATWKPVPQIVYTIHGLSFHPYQSNWLNKFYIAIEKAAAKRTDYFISVADAMTRQAKAAGIGLDKPYITAYSAVDEEAFLSPIAEEKRRQFRTQYGIKKDTIVLVTIARLFMLKGHDYIIESAKTLAKKYENVMWLFVGNGNLSDKFQRQVNELGLADRIKFTGLLPPSWIPLAIQSSDILVHCSLREGLARTLPQAMLCGKPAISFDVDGAREVVNENTGRLIEPKNVEKLTQACAELIEDADLRKRLGENGRESVKRKFAPEQMVNTVEKVYQKLAR
jgi:glycosyltransferase involved in cell wall biosynthesis